MKLIKLCVYSDPLLSSLYPSIYKVAYCPAFLPFEQLDPFFLFLFINSALQLLSFCSAFPNLFPTVGQFVELKRIWPVNQQRALISKYAKHLAW